MKTHNTTTHAQLLRKIDLLRQVMEMQISAPTTGTVVVMDGSSQLFSSPWSPEDLAELGTKMKELVARL